jgi:hypothetical protein
VCSLRTEDLLWFPPGEQLLCEASTVLKYVQEDSCQRGVYGRLVCTDFKIAFLGDDESALDNDVRMSCICWVWKEECSCGYIVCFPSFSVFLWDLSLLRNEHWRKERTVCQWKPNQSPSWPRCVSCPRSPLVLKTGTPLLLLSLVFCAAVYDTNLFLVLCKDSTFLETWVYQCFFPKDSLVSHLFALYGEMLTWISLPHTSQNGGVWQGGFT